MCIKVIVCYIKLHTIPPSIIKIVYWCSKCEPKVNLQTRKTILKYMYNKGDLKVQFRVRPSIVSKV